MNRVTDLVTWIETRLDEGGWVRRGYLVVATLMTWNFVIWAQQFAMTSLRPGGDIAMIIGAIGVPLSAVTGFAFSHYLESRKRASGDYSATTTSIVEVTK